jgi:hypothetical protein
MLSVRVEEGYAVTVMLPRITSKVNYIKVEIDWTEKSILLCMKKHLTCD